MAKAFLVSALVISVATPAVADVGPPIAYSIGRNVYLARADGTSIQLLYTGGTRKSIFNVKLKPGGGEVAFEETACCSVATSSLLKIVRYNYSGTVVGTPASITVCGRVAGLSYHPTDGSLLYSSTCNQPLKRLNPATMASSTITLPHQAGNPSWLPTGTDFIYSTLGKIWRVSLSNTSSPTEIGTAQCVQSLDAGNTTARALWTDACAGTVNLLTFSTGQSSVLRQGSQSYFSPTDAKYAYLSSNTSMGQYLLISALDGSGTQTRIGAKSKFLSVDWRK